MTAPDVVIGAGLGGLSAAIALAGRGRRVILLDRLARAGGVCGEWVHEGAVYVRGSVEFHKGTFDRLDELGVHVPWRPTRSRTFVGGDTLSLPPRLGEVGLWARGLPGLGVAAWRMRAGGTLADATAGASVATRRLLGALLQPGGLRFEDVSAHDGGSILAHALEDGLHVQGMAIGGPQRLVDALVDRARAVGVELRLGVGVTSVERGVVHTDAGPIEASAVLGARPRWDAWTGPSHEGVRLGQVLLWTPDGVALPDGLDTLYHLPADVRGWHDALGAGAWPTEPGWSLVDARLGDTPERRTLLGYVPLPLGMRSGGDGLLEDLVDRMCAAVPGLRARIRAAKLLLPDEYVALHGLEPAPACRFPDGDTRRPPSISTESGEVHLGASVEPPSLYGASVVRIAVAAARAVAS